MSIPPTIPTTMDSGLQDYPHGIAFSRRLLDLAVFTAQATDIAPHSATKSLARDNTRYLCTFLIKYLRNKIR